MIMITYQEINQCYAVDYCDWKETVRVHISDELQQQIEAAGKILEQHSFMFSIDIVTPADFLHEDDNSDLQKQCRYDVSIISVYDNGGLYWEIQSKYDASYVAEYDLTHLEGDDHAL